MSSGPSAEIVEEINVDLDRPRDRSIIEKNEVFIETKLKLEKHLLNETRVVEEVT